MKAVRTRHLTVADLAGKRWRGLVRESSERQAKRLMPAERQRDDLRRAATEIGMIPVEPLFYERTGSGEDEDVVELRRALADGRAGEFDVLVVLATNRFARNRAESVRMKAEFRKAGVIIYFVDKRLISGTYAGALAEGISEVVDEQDNEQRRFWIAGGIRQRQLSGRWIGSLPYGYRKVLVDFDDGTRGWDGGIEPDPEQAPLVRRIYDEYLGGRYSSAIVQGLNLDGLRNGAGRPWAISHVVTILRNPVYTGRYLRYRFPRTDAYYDPESEEGRADLGRPFPAIVSDEAWDQVQATRKHRRSRLVSRSYPLSGVLRCAGCGHTFTGAFTGNRYYRCSGRVEYRICDAPFIRADKVETAFSEWLGRYHLPDDWRDRIARSLVTETRSGERDRQAALGERLARIKNLYAWGDLDEADYRRESAALREQLGVMAMPRMSSLEAVAEALTTVGRAWLDPRVPVEVREALPSLILQSAQVYAERIEWVVRAELRPLLEECVVEERSAYSTSLDYTVRYSA